MNLTALLNFESMVKKGAQTQSSEVNQFVARSIRAIIEGFFLKMAPSFIIVVSCRRNSPLNFYLNIMQYLFNMVDYMIVQLVFIDFEKPQRIEGTRMYNLLLVDSLEAFLDIDIISYTRGYDTNEYYHIFLMQRDRSVYSDMQGIFDYCWTNHIINCNVQYQNALKEVLMYTYFPFTPGKCGNTKPEFINQFINDSWLSTNYFASKLNNFYGCPLVVMARDIAPYLYRAYDKNGVVTFKGFEIDMMKHLSKKMNFTLDIRSKLRDDRSFPLGNGALKTLSERTADAVFGFYRKRADVNPYYTTTFPYFQNNIVNIIYLPGHTLNTFEVLSYPFPNTMWFALAISSVVILIITRLMRKSQTQSISTFSMIACALGSSISRQPNLPHSVLLFATWLWSTFLLRCFYSGLLYHLFRHEVFGHLPNTLEDAIAESYRAVMNRFTFEDVKNIPFYQRSTNHTSIIIDTTDELLPIKYLEEHENENLYAIVSQEFVIHYTEIFHKPGLFYRLPGNLMQQQMCIYLAKHSYLVDKFDAEIMDIHAVGLMEFWAKHYINNKYALSTHMFPDAKIDQDDLWGIYIICCGLYVLAFLIFLIERLSLKLRLLRKLFQ